MYFWGSTCAVPLAGATVPRLAAAWAKALFRASSRDRSFVGVEIARDFGLDFFRSGTIEGAGGGEVEALPLL